MAVVLAVIAVALAGATALRSRALVPDTIALVGNAVVAKANGRLLWQYPLEKPNWAPADATWRTDPDSPVRPVDLDSNGVAEYLALLHLVRTDDGFVQNNLIALSSSGKQLWRYEPATVLTYGDRKFDGPWRIVGWTLTPGPRPTVWVNVIHHIWWPSFVVSIDPDGKAAVRFVQPGHIYSLAQLDREGRSYVTAAGISNDYHAATLAVLEIDRGSGTPPTFDAAYQCSDCLAGEPLRYLVFPRSELNVALRKPYNRVYDVSMHEKAMDVSVEEGTDPKFRAVYRLSTGFIPETFAFSDSYWEAHRRLETNGTLDHGADTCPSRRAGATVRIWERGRGWTEKVVQFSEGAHRH